jgi:ATP-binding cassette, subfamily A (ABC1), member 3
MRCLGSAQRLRTKYGKGYQIEIGVELPTSLEIVAYSTEIAKTLNLGTELSDDQLGELSVTEAQIKACFTAMKKEQWIERLSHTSTGADLVNAYTGTGSVSLKHFASWFILEGYFDSIHEFLTATFTTFIVHERQPTKLRIEVSADLPSGGKRQLSGMFSAIEANKTQLHIKGYSMAQTSLEQIFNFFAQQQEEEQGSAGAMGPA